MEQYLKEYVGRYYETINAMAKVNSTQEIPFFLENATNKRWSENFKDKHGVDV